MKFFLRSFLHRPEEIAEIVTPPSDLNAPMENGHLPLHVAVRQEDSETIRSLIEQGADYTLPDADGLTALDYATLRPNEEVLKALFSKNENKGFF